MEAKFLVNCTITDPNLKTLVNDHKYAPTLKYHINQCKHWATEKLSPNIEK